MNGIENGIDREATCGLLQSRRCMPYDRGCLRSILSDSIWTEELAWKAKKTDSSHCKFCGEAVAEDLNHLWWVCPAWSQIRSQHPKATNSVTSTSPECLRLCGVVPAGLQPTNNMWDGWEPAARHAPQIVELTDDANHVVDLPDNDDKGTALRSGWRPAVTCPQYDERTSHGRIVVFTDGASRDNQHREIRRGGYGMFWGRAHPFNTGLPLPGRIQTNQRAELMAAVAALELDLRPLEIRSDSKYVVNGAMKLRHTWKSNGW